MEQELLTIFQKALYQSAFKKGVFSRPKDKNELRMVATLFLQKDAIFLRCEHFLKDGKAIHKNIPYSQAKEHLGALAASYRQINILTECGDCEIRISEKGKLWVQDKIKTTGEAPKAAPHNREKEYLIDTEAAFPFLHALGLVDRDGRILDRKRAKFKQINKFLEFVTDALPHLPKEGTLTVWDLCCGKSYLSFAVYFYLAIQLKRPVEMYAVDRKQDVIASCQMLAQKLNYNTLHFQCMDIHDFKTETAPDLVLSLHACDIATDIVLAHAIKNQAKVILSSPCCHHELNGQLNCESMRFIEKHSILKQKFCDAATDALRCLRLEAEGYSVNALEFIDPDETPKNVLIRAYYKGKPSEQTRKKRLEEYERICTYLQAAPFLKRQLEKTNP